MMDVSLSKKFKQIWVSHNTSIALILLITIFISYAGFIALNLKPGIIPDEERHFAVSKQFATTLGIPPDVPETLSLNAIIKQNPNLYFWINGRALNIINLINPSSSDWQNLVSLRLINVIYAVGTVIFCYLFSKELIDHKWGQLLPVFLLTNTIMFVFLAGGVNDDNLTHLFNVAGLYFLSRVLNHRGFVVNSIALMICLAASTLIKHRVFPFVFSVGVVWVINLVKNYREIIPLKIKGMKNIILGIILLSLIWGNLSIYGYNLITYQSFLPSCSDIYKVEKCNLRINYLEQRGPEYILAYHKGSEYRLSISESLELGYPGPFRYFFTIWIPFMFLRTYGVLGHRYHYSVPATLLHLILFYWMILLALIYWRDYSLIIISLLGILLFYSVFLFIYIYKYELLLRFNHNFLQGRYMFSVINIYYVFVAKVLKDLPWNFIRVPTLAILILVYFLSGPFLFVLNFASIYSDWIVI